MMTLPTSKLDGPLDFNIPRGCPGKLRAAIRALLASPRRSPSLGDLAARAAWSRYHLCRSFTAYLGRPPHQLHLELRLERARTLLDAGLSCCTVSSALGFCDQSAFTRAFKRRWGMTPRQLARTRTAPASPAP
jgi:transcriptional regulator GlxA family with amidase domain